MRYDGSGILDLVGRPVLRVVESGLLQKSHQQLPRESQQQAAHIGFSDTCTVCKKCMQILGFLNKYMYKLIWTALDPTFVLTF